MKKAKVVLSLLMALVMALTGIITAFAADLEEKEPNNEMAKATVFALADTIKGRLSDAGLVTDKPDPAADAANAAAMAAAQGGGMY